jgi:hypothetical protein
VELILSVPHDIVTDLNNVMVVYQTFIPSVGGKKRTSAMAYPTLRLQIQHLNLELHISHIDVHRIVLAQIEDYI